ncbi:MAG TPA: TetR/AcrR family transcriptional regulator, partial [Mycobacterium sp.]|nr:TetR/AcrR family transcriptional regulator [Mycobacterium sp.]
KEDGSFPLADPERDAIAISAVVSREMTSQSPDDERQLQRSLARVLDFALRALGAQREAADRR